MNTIARAVCGFVLSVAGLTASAQQQGVTADNILIGAFGPITGP